MRKPIVLLFVFILSFLTACGPKQVAVKYADNYLESQVEKRLPLYEAQEAALSKDVDRFLNSHKDRVRKLIPLLEKIDFNRAESLDENWPKFSEAYLHISNDFAKIIAKHMSNFDEKQTKDFLRKMKEENLEIFERDREERRDKIEARLRKFLGEITPEQKKILKGYQNDLDQQVVIRSERRARLHTKLKEILEQDVSSDTKKKMISDEFATYQEEAINNSKNLEIAKAFIPTLTKPQKQELRKNIAELKELLTYFIETVY